MAFPLTDMSLTGALREFSPSDNNLAQPKLRRRQFKNLTSGPVSTADLRGSVACIHEQANPNLKYDMNWSWVSGYGTGISSPNSVLDHDACLYTVEWIIAKDNIGGFLLRSFGMLPDSGRVRVTATGSTKHGTHTSINSEIIGSRYGFLEGGNIYYGTPSWPSSASWNTRSYEFDIDPEFPYLSVMLQSIGYGDRGTYNCQGSWKDLKVKLI